MPIPQNAQNVYQFLTSHGYTPIAASGIVGNIEQESGGDPTAPGGGLIQILGHTGGSLASEEQAILTYNNQQGSSLINSLNSQSSPSSAALFYSQYFERPLASAANNPNREQSAAEVYQAAQSGNWSAGGGAASTPATTTGILSGLSPSSLVSGIAGAIGSHYSGTIKDWLERAALIFLGGALVLLGIHLLSGGSPPKAVKTYRSKPKTSKPAWDLPVDPDEVP